MDQPGSEFRYVRSATSVAGVAGVVVLWLVTLERRDYPQLMGHLVTEGDVPLNVEHVLDKSPRLRELGELLHHLVRRRASETS